jgi:hypothetical protein
VRSAGLWTTLLSVERAVIERVDFDEDADAIVVPYGRKATKRRCGKPGGAIWLRPRPGAVALAGVGPWHGARLPGGRQVQTACPTHRVVVAQVPWTPEASSKRAPVRSGGLLINIETGLQSLLKQSAHQETFAPYSVRWAPRYGFEPRAQVVLG